MLTTICTKKFTQGSIRPLIKIISCYYGGRTPFSTGEPFCDYIPDYAPAMMTVYVHSTVNRTVHYMRLLCKISTVWSSWKLFIVWSSSVGPSAQIWLDEKWQENVEWSAKILRMRYVFQADGNLILPAQMKELSMKQTTCSAIVW